MSSLSPLNLFLQKVSRLEEQEKEVVSALRYFKTIVDKMVVEKKVLEMLPGSASKVLEAILPLVQGEARIQHRWVTPVWNLSWYSHDFCTVHLWPCATATFLYNKVAKMKAVGFWLAMYAGDCCV